MVNGQNTSKGKRVDYGKTHAAIRPIPLPDWAVAILRRRKLEQPPNDIDAVFASRNGTWHFPGNVQSRLWHIRQLDEYTDIAALRDVSTHSFRLTVATEIDEVYDADAAKDQLGHTSKTVTERHYINRRLVVPDYRAATERLAPRTEPTDDPAIGPEPSDPPNGPREPSSHYTSAYGPFFAFWRGLRARQRGGRKLKVRPKSALSPDFRCRHQRPDSHHRRSEPAFVSKATHSTWWVIGKRSNARSCRSS